MPPALGVRAKLVMGPGAPCRSCGPAIGPMRSPGAVELSGTQVPIVCRDLHHSDRTVGVLPRCRGFHPDGLGRWTTVAWGQTGKSPAGGSASAMSPETDSASLNSFVALVPLRDKGLFDRGNHRQEIAAA